MTNARATSRFDAVIERSVAAPRELVWRAWTQPEHLSRWWGPRGFSAPVCRFEARAGGEIYIEMRGPDGTVYPMSGRVLELDPPSRLVFLSAALDPAGKPLFEVETAVQFSEESSGGTAIRVNARVVSTKPGAEIYLGGMHEGWSQSLERLAALLSARGGREVQ